MEALSKFRKKALTTIQGKTNKLTVFEGFMDYLSALTYFADCSNHSTVVLNGVGQIGQLLRKLANYQKVFLFIDNNAAGKAVAEK